MNNRQTIWNTLKIAAALALCAAFASSAFAEVSRVSNGKSMTPIGASNYQQVGNLPMNMVLSPDGKFAFTTDMGFHESLWCLNARTGVGIDHIVFGNPELYSPVGLYFGLAVQADGKGTYTVYAGQGSNNTIAVIDVASNGTLTKRKAIQGQDGDFTTGIALDGNNHLYVVNNEYYTAEDAITGAEDVNSLLQPGSLAIYDLGTDKQIARVPFYSNQNTAFAPAAQAAEAAGKDDAGLVGAQGNFTESGWDGNQTSGNYSVALMNGVTLPVFALETTQGLTPPWPGTLSVSWTLGGRGGNGCD